MNMIQAINSALDNMLERDDNVVIFGEDVGYFGGVFRCTAGLQKKHGKTRVFDSPISEGGILGTAVGMGAYGLRPVVEIQFADYIYPAFDQLVSEAARLRYRSAGEFWAPLTVRAPCGGGILGGQTHSQSPEGIFTHVSGLKTVMPSNPYDAKGLLISAIEDDDPVMFFEPKRIYNGPFDGHHDKPLTSWAKHPMGEVPEGYYKIPLGKAAIARAGKAVTMIAYGTMVHVCLAAAEESGIDAEVIDLRSLLPIDIDTIAESVKKTGRCVIVHEATRTGGFGAELLSLVQENCFYDLEAPIELSMSAALAGRLKLRAVPVSLDAGTVAGQQLPLFGAMNLALAAGVAAESASFQQDASGVAVGAAYEVGNLKLDLGSTPLGFQLETLVGGVSWSPKAGRTSYKIDLSRRSMTDSLLSYGGAHDPATGKDWGGVTKNGGRLDIAYDMGPYGVYGAGSYHVLDGENVARNNVFEFGGGIYARALDRRTQRVTYGLNLTAFFYDKNLRRFSLGQGGYFSPQSYLSVAVPVEWTGHRDRMSWRLGGALGVQAFREDAQVYYPNDSALQAQLVALAAEDEDLEVDYPSQSSTGIGFNFGGELEYLLAPNLALGAHAGIDNARDYNETGFFGYVRYMFDPQSRLGDAPMPIVPNYAWGH